MVAPKRVAEHVWKTEASLWRPDLRVSVAAGTPATRRRVLESSADIIVIGRDNLADAVPHAGKFRTFILDELSSFKSRGSVRWKAARKIATHHNMVNVWGLTGTPAPNSYLDLWAQVALLDGGERLGKTLTSYRERYFTPGWQLPSGVVTRWDARPGAESRINDLLSDLCLSMTSKDYLPDLPQEVYNPVEVPLPPKVMRIYNDMKGTMVTDLEDLFGPLQTSVHSASGAAVLGGKLQQISSGFLYPDDADLLDGLHYTKLHDAKIKAVREIVDGTGSPVVVAYNYQAELDMLKKEFGADAHTMGEKGVLDRWDRGEIPVLLIHPKGAGHGLNLQKGGHTLVWTTLPWSLEEFQQTNKRLPRQGQQETVMVHMLMSPGTVDHAVLQALEGKASLQDGLMDHLASPI